MATTDPDGQGDERSSFELEDESEPSSPIPPQSQKAPRRGSPTQHPPPRAAQRRRTPAESGADTESTDPLTSFLGERRKRRLLIYGSVMLLLWLLVGWLFAGTGLGWFALMGVAVGLFAGWRQQNEVLLGSISAVAGFVACLLAVQFPLLFVIVATGLIGFFAGIDDRLRNS